MAETDVENSHAEAAQQKQRSRVHRTPGRELGSVSSKTRWSAIDKHLRMLCSSSTGASAICTARGKRDSEITFKKPSYIRTHLLKRAEQPVPSQVTDEVSLHYPTRDEPDDRQTPRSKPLS